MKSGNLIISLKSQDEVDKVVREYKYIGREVTWDYNKLTVTLLALPMEYKKKRERDAKVAAKREREEEDIDQYQ
jgi:hypothetical protein